MMMMAPNSLIHQKEGVQGEEEVENRSKAGSTGTPTPGADAPIGPTRSGMSDARSRRKDGRWCGVLIHRRGAERARTQSYPITTGMDVATERTTKLSCERVIL